MKRATEIRGFTLLEMVVVVAILSLLVGAAVPMLVAESDRRKHSETHLEMVRINDAVTMYVEDTGTLPGALSDLVADTRRGYGGPYIVEASTTENEGGLQDGWDRIYRYERISARRYRLTSSGADGSFGGSPSDDLVHEGDVGSVLRALSEVKRRFINAAISNYNSLEDTRRSPLPRNIRSLLTRLQSSGYLPTGQGWTADAFGAEWMTSGNPVTYVRSQSYGTDPAGDQNTSSGRPGRGRTRNQPAESLDEGGNSGSQSEDSTRANRRNNRRENGDGDSPEAAPNDQANRGRRSDEGVNSGQDEASRETSSAPDQPGRRRGNNSSGGAPRGRPGDAQESGNNPDDSSSDSSSTPGSNGNSSGRQRENESSDSNSSGRGSNSRGNRNNSDTNGNEAPSESNSGRNEENQRRENDSPSNGRGRSSESSPGPPENNSSRPAQQGQSNPSGTNTNQGNNQQRRSERRARE